MLGDPGSARLMGPLWGGVSGVGPVVLCTSEFLISVYSYTLQLVTLISRNEKIMHGLFLKFGCRACWIRRLWTLVLVCVQLPSAAGD